MTLDLRAIDPGEVEAVCDLWHQGWRDGHEGHVPQSLIQYRQRSVFLERLRGSLPDCAVAGPFGAPLGFIRTKGDELDQFYVAPGARGTGFATDLIRAAEDRLRHQGVGRAHLFCLDGNPRAERFYVKSGWQNVGIEDLPAETLAQPINIRCIRFEKSL